MAITDYADMLGAAITAAGIPYALTVTRTTLVDPDTPWDPSDDVETPVPHACQGWVDQYEQANIDGTVIQSNDRRVFILASSLDITPSTADTITLDSVSYTIARVSIDAAGACWELQCRR